MQTILPEQQQLIYRALLEFAQKQEDILDRHSFDNDVEGELNESQAILDKLGPILSVFFDKKDPVYLISQDAKNGVDRTVEDSVEVYGTDCDYPTKTGHLMGCINTIKYYLNAR
jgi:hypothetical protein